MVGSQGPTGAQGHRMGNTGLHCAAARKPEGESPQNRFPRVQSAQKGVAQQKMPLLETRALWTAAAVAQPLAGDAC